MPHTPVATTPHNIPEDQELPERQILVVEQDKDDNIEPQVAFYITALERFYYLASLALRHIMNGIVLTLANNHTIRMTVLTYLLNSLYQDHSHRAATPIIETVISLFGTLAASPLFAIERFSGTASSNEAAAGVAQQAILLSAVMGSIVTPVYVTSPQSAIKLFTHNKTLIDISSDFLSDYGWALPAILTSLAIQQFLLGNKEIKHLVGIEVYKAVFGFSIGTLLALNTASKEKAFIATQIGVEYASLLIYILLTKFHPNLKPIPFYKMPQGFASVVRQMKPLAKLGASILINNLLTLSYFLVSGTFTGKYSIPDQAALATVNWYKSYPMLILFGLVLNTTSGMNRLIGEKKYIDAVQKGKIDIVLSLVTISTLFTIGGAIYFAFLAKDTQLTHKMNQLFPLIVSQALVDVVHLHIVYQLRDALNSANLVNAAALFQVFVHILGCWLGRDALGISSVPVSQLCSTTVTTVGLGFFWRQRNKPETITTNAQPNTLQRVGFFPVAQQEDVDMPPINVTTNAESSIATFSITEPGVI